MPSTSNPNVQADNYLFTVANLALWAGDAQGAEDRFSTVVHRNQASRTTLSVFGSPLVSSSQCALRQLRRHLREYERLGQVANLGPNNVLPQPALHSRGAHLSGMVWGETEREFELRCYLNDLSWEASFYRIAAALAQDSIAMSNVANLHYGIDMEQSLSSDEPTAVADLGLEWTLSLREMVLHVAVSDFCTLTARGIWIANAPPSSGEVILSVFQEFLDKFDPGD